MPMQVAPVDRLPPSHEFEECVLQWTVSTVEHVLGEENVLSKPMSAEQAYDMVRRNDTPKAGCVRVISPNEVR